MPVQARKLIRKMRGGAQAHMLQADDGRYYITKFVNNPQGTRILVNEWIAAKFLGYLEIAQPHTAIIEVSQEFLAENPEIYLQRGSHRDPILPGWHFGSCFPGDPNRQAVYDFIPDVLLPKVSNFAHFLGVLVFDKWAGNADARQAIFFRAKLNEWMPSGGAPATKLGFLAQMVDHGYILDGPHWGFPESPLQGLYFRTEVYNQVTSYTDFQPWLDRVVHFPEEIVDQAYREIPPQWLGDDSGLLESLLEKLLRRCKRVPDLIRECTKANKNPFPNWT